ncbi:hypothetical protein SNE40_008718 [Patella caerulea]|uniref:Asl1-like glycosyl hydrolase catalytic domain-containing protein n=1 Tax=Patella caerulea TaxID=87958 RepID=A0AAN8Q208_PATCE
MLRYVVLLLMTTSLHITLAKSSKKGVGICSSAFKCGDTWKFDGVAWWYDWRFDQGERKWAKCKGAARPGYIPMIFDGASANRATIPRDAKTVLGFNEPNWQNQANMTPRQAARVWRIVERKAGNRRLVSPAVGGCDVVPKRCFDWLGAFFRACRGCRVDFVAFHGYSCNANTIMSAIQQVHQRFNRKIWLTEFGCRHMPNEGATINFMKIILPKLERSPYVGGYAWFCHRQDANHGRTLPHTSLMYSNRPALNRVGRFYNNFAK